MITKELLTISSAKKVTISTAESCTGGLVASMITDVDGSSQVFIGGVVAYSNDVKMNVLEVNAETLKEHGAVSTSTAKEMAEGVRKLLNTTYAVATTGIAGPQGGTSHKPVGTVAIAVAGPDQTTSELFLFHGDRETLKKEFAFKALSLLKEQISL